MSYSHLTIIERGQLETLYRLGWSARAIARHLGRHHATISREIKRSHAGSAYEALASEQQYRQRRKACVPRGKYSLELAYELQEKLSLTWSPEQIAEKRRIEGKPFVCFETIYRWIYSGRLAAGDVQVLRHKGKRRKAIETRGRFLVGTPISQRPKEVRKRTTFGHWELDTIVSSRGKSKACAATFIERKSRLYIALKIPDRIAYSMEVACGVVASQYPKNAFQSATVDRGKEFACYSSVENLLGIHVYFADPYSSWQRGTNENANGLLREFFPKGHDLATVTEAELARMLLD